MLYPASLSNFSIISSKCDLGEGLFVNGLAAAWVDINKSKIFLYKNSLTEFDVKNRPSVIYQMSEDILIFGSENGICKIDLKNKTEELINDITYSSNLNLKDFRSNDGGYCGDFQYLGFMHKNNPEKYSGYIFLIKDEKWILIDNKIHIPNSFIDLGNNFLLISDSLSSEIWLFNFAADGELRTKKIWRVLGGGQTPDGGCKIGEYIYLSMWDDNVINIYNLKGEYINNFKVPVLRPTNCKFDEYDSKLWITSASCGLNKEQLSDFPESGNTFAYKLKNNEIC
tara:strand:+ start:2871 stop:3719 length:849 start_codon:yes stop_codon:yes gene_type:complete